MTRVLNDELIDQLFGRTVGQPFRCNQTKLLQSSLIERELKYKFLFHWYEATNSNSKNNKDNSNSSNSSNTSKNNNNTNYNTKNSKNNISTTNKSAAPILSAGLAFGA